MDVISYALAKSGTSKAVTDYLDEHLTNPTNPPVDTSLSISGAAADSKETGSRIGTLMEGLNDLTPTILNAFPTDIASGAVASFPDSADMIADANITSGQYFMVGNSLYKATANIANGSAIVVGTNCTRKSLSEALNEINAS